MANKNKSRKFFATATSAALVASAIVPVASAASFTDADKIGSWAKEAVDFLADKEIITGNPDGSFNPEGKIERAQAAKMFTVALDLSTEGTEDFSDVTEGQWFYKYVVAVSNAGIVEGKGEGLFAPKANLTRAEAAKMIVEAYKLTGEADLSTFADADTVAGKWSEAYLSTAVANGVINGKDGKLAANDSISRQEFAVMLKRAIDAENKVEEDVTEEVTVESVTAVNGTLTVTLKEKAEKVDVKDFTVTQAINDGEAKEVTPSKAELSEDGLTVTLTVAQVAAQETTSQSVVYTVNEVAASAFVVEASTLAVKSVTAINASQILVTFSKEVDETTAESASNYTINGTSGTTALATASGAVKPAVLQEDNKSVLLTLNQTTVPYSKGKVLAVTVDGVQQADDASKVINQFAESITLNDTEAAAITSVVSKAASTTTTVTFKVSEPIVTTGAVFKVNGENIVGSPIQSGTDPLEYIITTASPLVAGQTYDLEVYNLADTAADSAASKPANLLTTTKSFTVVGQTSTAGLQTVVAKGDNKIELTFADDVDKTSLELAGNVKVLLPDGTALTNSTDFTVAQNTKDPKKATISLTNDSNKLYSAANDITLTVIVTDAVKDSVGNKQPLKQQTVTLTKDTVAPKATSARALKDATGKITGFEVTYDSDLKVTTPTTTGLRAINAKGTEITTNLGFATSTGAVVATAPNKLTVTLPSPVAISSDVSGTVRLILPEIANLTDDSTQANKAQATTVNVVLDDSITSGIAVSSVGDGSSDNQYTVVFSKEPKLADVLNNSNYKLNGETLPADTLITYSATTKTATIEVPNSFAKKGDTSAILAVSGIHSADETETIATYYGKVTLKDKVAPVLTAAVLNADNTVTLTFDEALSTAPTTTNALEIKINNTVTGSLTATAATGSDAGAGKYVIDLGSLIKYDSSSTSTYLDIDGDNTKDANEPVFATSDITSNATVLANLLKNNSLVSDITFGTIASPTVTDAASNPAKGGIVIKVK